MLKRTLTGACLVAVVVGFFLLRNYVDTRLFHILIAIFCALGTFELMRALGDRAACMPYVMIYGVGVIPAYVLGGVAAAAVVFGLFAVSFCLLCLLDRTMKAKQLFLTLFAMVYPSFFLVAMAAVNDMGGNGYFALLLIFLVSPAADTFAYLVGSLLKGPKLCPKLSPNKTISGAIGGLVGGRRRGDRHLLYFAPGAERPLSALLFGDDRAVRRALHGGGRSVRELYQAETGHQGYGKDPAGARRNSGPHRRDAVCQRLSLLRIRAAVTLSFQGYFYRGTFIYD